MQHLVAVRFRTDDLCRQLSVAEGDMRSRLRFAPRTGEAFPVPAAEIAQQHDLHAAARRPRTEEPRRDHAGIVHHKAVALVEKVRELVEDVVLGCPRALVQCQKARGVAPLERRLGDKLRREIIVKVRFFQNCSICRYVRLLCFAAVLTLTGVRRSVIIL